MSELKFSFSDNQEVSGALPSILEHVFASSVMEEARQRRGEVCVGILARACTDIVRTGDCQKRAAKRANYERRLEESGALLSELGCFDITIGYDEGDPEALDIAVQALVLTLAEWAHYTGTLVAFSVHVTQAGGEGAYEPVHMHVLWGRRRGEKLYRDNVLQWYLHEQFRKDSNL